MLTDASSCAEWIYDLPEWTMGHYQLHHCLHHRCHFRCLLRFLEGVQEDPICVSELEINQ